MSFEGHYNLLCKNGHYNTIDVYSVEFGNPLDNKCRTQNCREVMVWGELVDDTNCDGEDTVLEVLEKELICICPCCDNTHISKEQTYKVPLDTRIGFHRKYLSF